MKIITTLKMTLSVLVVVLASSNTLAAPVTGGLGLLGLSVETVDGVDFGDLDGILDSDAAIADVLFTAGDLEIPSLLTVSIFDFSLDQSFPVDGRLLSADLGGGNTLTFDITSIALIDNGGSEIDYAGTGIINLTGFDATNAVWNFSETGGVTYSLSVTAIPLPAVGPLAYLVFAGMLGLKMRKRRLAS